MRMRTLVLNSMRNQNAVYCAYLCIKRVWIQCENYPVCHRECVAWTILETVTFYQYQSIENDEWNLCISLSAIIKIMKKKHKKKFHQRKNLSLNCDPIDRSMVRLSVGRLVGWPVRSRPMVRKYFVWMRHM